MAELLFDPQTSGGLLIAVPEDDAIKLLADLQASGNLEAEIIGHALPAGKFPIELV
jgi:selenide,water dikinase